MTPNRRRAHDEINAYLHDLASREPEAVVRVVRNFILFDGDWPYETEEHRQGTAKRSVT